MVIDIILILILKNIKKSAISFHIYDKRNEYFDQKLDNNKVDVIRSTSPLDLDKLEDFYVGKTKAEFLGLNRYKVLK